MSKQYTLKIKMDETVWRRLEEYAFENEITPAEAAAKALDKSLPDKMRKLLAGISALSNAEKRILKKSFYSIVYFVSYAYHKYSLKEKLAIIDEFKKLRTYFGKPFTDFLSLDSKQQEELKKSVDGMSFDEKRSELMDLKTVLDQLPEVSVEMYKLVVLSSAIRVSKASKERLLTGKRISDVEMEMLYTVVMVLDIAVEDHEEYFDKDWLKLYQQKLIDEEEALEK